MKTGLLALFAAGMAISLSAAGQAPAPQGGDFVGHNLRYSSGQEVQPIFEGWSKNDDGTFQMHFGYVNRNYVEEVSVPLGPQNNIEPGGPDQGQPTYFYPRINRAKFSVKVPKDFGKKELVWTISFRGKVTKAVGWLQPEWEVNSTGNAGRVPAKSDNQPPTIAFPAGGQYKVTLPTPLALVAAVTDDGLPKPRTGGGNAEGGRKQPVGQETPPILQPSESTVEAPINLPELRLNLRGGRIGPRPPQGLSVGYTIWRGPAAIKFDPPYAVPKDGKATTTMTFAQPGEYVLRARAWDGALAKEEDIKITVAGAQP
jgi:hypothetical protein